MSSSPIPNPQSLIPKLLPCLLFLIAVGIYLNTLPNEFVFDSLSILRNASLHDLSNLGAVLGGTRRILPKFSLAVNWAIGGPNPLGYHLFNLIIHALAGLALFGLVRRTLQYKGTRDPGTKGPSVLPLGPSVPGSLGPSLLAFAIALLWIVHPLNTQAVSYVIQRSASMMGLFYLLTLYCLVRLAQSQCLAGDAQRPPHPPSPLLSESTEGASEGAGISASPPIPNPQSLIPAMWAALTLLACALGMISKEVMVTAPIAALLFDRCFLAGSFPHAFRKRWWLYLLLPCTWALFLLGGFSGLTATQSSAGFGIPVISWWQYLLSQGEVILHYIRLAFWPHPLVLDYLWLPSALMLSPWTKPWIIHLLIPDLIVLALLLISLVGLWRNTVWGFLSFAFFLVLSVTSSILPISDLAFEHRMYLPLITIIALVILAIHRLLLKFSTPPGLARFSVRSPTPPGLARFSVRSPTPLQSEPTGGASEGAGISASSPIPNPQSLIPSFFLLLCVAGLLAYLTIQRNFEYRTRITMWTTVIHRAPYSPRAVNNLANSMAAVGRNQEAMRLYERELAMLPPHASMTADARNNMGAIWLQRGDIDRGIAHFQAALEIKPDDAQFNYNLGRAYLLKRDFKQARHYLDRALKLNPRYAKAMNQLGVLFIAQGKPDQAADEFRKAAAISPDLPDPQYNLALLNLHQGQYAAAAHAFEQALHADPDHLQSLGQLARLLATAPDPAVRDPDKAMKLLDRYAKIKPQLDVRTVDTLAAVYARAGRFDKAVHAQRLAIAQAQRQKLPPSVLDQMRARLTLYQNHQPYERKAK